MQTNRLFTILYLLMEHKSMTAAQLACLLYTSTATTEFMQLAHRARAQAFTPHFRARMQNCIAR